MTHKILFVCLGNICRSPLAEGVFRDLVAGADREADFEIDSAGTGAWHVGDPPDPRSIETAAKHGIDISGQKARQIEDSDFDRFDTIVAMDHNNLMTLKARGEGGQAHMRLLLNDPPDDVPDPYCGERENFENVYQMVRTGAERLLDTLTGQQS